MIRMTRCLIPVLLLLLAGCGAITGKKDPFTVYAPRYTPPARAANAPRIEWQLAIDTPLASDTLDTSHMLVMPTPGAIESYKGARWSDAMPMLLRGLLIQAFQDSGRITGVGAITSGLHADYSLTIDLYDFETQYRDGSPHAVIRLNAKLNDFSVNRVRAARTFEVDTPVAGAEAAEAAAAFNQALNDLLPQIVEWTFEQGQVNWGREAR
jgi:cholesterol transport system auxiliary component